MLPFREGYIKIFKTRVLKLRNNQDIDILGHVMSSIQRKNNAWLWVLWVQYFCNVKNTKMIFTVLNPKIKSIPCRSYSNSSESMSIRLGSSVDVNSPCLVFISIRSVIELIWMRPSSNTPVTPMNWKYHSPYRNDFPSNLIYKREGQISIA